MRRLVALLVVASLISSCVPMTLARRLLMAGGGGSFTPPYMTGIPADGTWTRHGPAVVIAPTQAWEETSVQELIVLPDGSGGWIGWGKGGWASGGATGYYTSADGVTWTHYASNPVLGRGGSSVSATQSQPEVREEGSTLYQYVNSPADTINSAYVYTSTDGLAWTIANSGSPYITSGSITSWGNRTVWKEGSTYYMLQEGRIGVGAWLTYLLSSSSPTSGWSFANGGAAVAGLSPGGGAGYGGPMLATGGPIGGTYHLYYHAGSSPTSDIYHATSTDRVNWTITNSGNPILTHSGSSPETDQVADPSVQLYAGTWFMWFAAVDNTANTGRIELATAPAT